MTNTTPTGIAAIAATHPDRVALVVPGAESWTFQQLNNAIDQLAQRLAAAGLVAGDAVALLGPNSPEWIVTYHAALRAGLALVPVNWHLRHDDIAYVVADSGAKAVVADQGFAEVIAGVELPLMIAIGSIDGYESFADALADQPTTPLVGRPAGQVMIYTSGTTGRPKGVRQEHSEAGSAQGSGITALFGFEPGDSMLCTAPLYHSGPSRICCEWPLAAGLTVVVMERFDAAAALDLIAEHGISHAFFVPTMFERMLKLSAAERSADVSSLRFVLHGAGPITVATKQAMFDWFGPIIHEIYAASEAFGTWVTPNEWLAKPGTVGRTDSTKIQIRADDGTVVDTGVVGAVWFAAGASRMHYHGDPDKTADTYDASGDWLTVGDHGHVDEDGYLFLVGRSAEVIVAGGVNIYPARIDEALQQLPEIVDAAAVGIPDDEYGEAIGVAAIPADGVSLEALTELVQAHCRSELGSQMVPREVRITDSLPRSDAGKLYRHQLRYLFED